MKISFNQERNYEILWWNKHSISEKKCETGYKIIKKISYLILNPLVTRHTKRY